MRICVLYDIELSFHEGTFSCTEILTYVIEQHEMFIMREFRVFNFISTHQRVGEHMAQFLMRIIFLTFLTENFYNSEFLFVAKNLNLKI